MKKILFVLLATLITITLSQSCKKDGPESEIPTETLITNTWIYENMALYYLWNTQMTLGIDYEKEADPEAYFYKLLYDEKDKWSYITDDYPKLAAELSGVPETMGYYPAFYQKADSKVFIVVCYVYPDSPAAEAGLERGDIIISIDNTPLDTANYYTKYSGTSYSVQLATIVNNVLTPTGESISMTARIVQADPSIYHTVLDISGTKIGYLVYVEFIPGNDDAYLEEMDIIFNEFKSAGISDLIVDLRYNPGGAVDAAIHLASEIVPLTIASNSGLMIRLEYNADLQYYLVANSYNNYLYYNFYPATGNLNLGRVYFLTTGRSASASELVIAGLDPYMEVVQIGTPTYGKYVGSWVIPDDNNEWAMMPIVSKFINNDGFTDFEDGLTPDHVVEDDLFSALPFGNVNDPMIAKAIELATGKSMLTPKSGVLPSGLFKPIFPEKMFQNKSLIIPELKVLK